MKYVNDDSDSESNYDQKASAACRATAFRRLHILTAHLQRYDTELCRLEYIIKELGECYRVLNPSQIGPKSRSETNCSMNADADVRRLKAQVLAVIRFRDELEKKTKNILDLVRRDSRMLDVLYFSGKANWSKIAH